MGLWKDKARTRRLFELRGWVCWVSCKELESDDEYEQILTKGHMRLGMDDAIQLVFTLEAHDSYPMSY